VGRGMHPGTERAGPVGVSTVAARIGRLGLALLVAHRRIQRSGAGCTNSNSSWGATAGVHRMQAMHTGGGQNESRGAPDLLHGVGFQVI
jgi:hypothetical protein